MQNGDSVTVAYIDFNKAFDCVSHEKLFFCFVQYGILGELLVWLKEFFTARSHQTRVGQSLSDLAELLSGVIHSSGIGPVAFVIFIDTLAKLLEAHNIKSKMFADDVKVYMSVALCSMQTMLPRFRLH